jgi:hypothetical protein
MSTKHTGPPFTRAEPVAGSALRRCRFSGLGRLPSTSSVGRGDLHRLSLNNCSLNNFFSNSRNRVTLCRSKERVHATSTARKKRRPWRLGTIFYGNWAEPIEKSQIGRMIPRESKSWGGKRGVRDAKSLPARPESLVWIRLSDFHYFSSKGIPLCLSNSRNFGSIDTNVTGSKSE